METQGTQTFQPGSQVIYALHGKCQVVAIENRTIGNEQIPFYKLEVVKPALSRSTRPEPAIWLPILNARDRGLRAPVTRDEADLVISILTNREYYFQLQEPFHSVLPKLEACIRTEGAIGLAKVYSYLYVLKRKLIVAPSEVNRFQESVTRLLMRELSETLGETARAIEDRISKGLRQKMLPDN
jgi:RNA polymerase-interacting CarD/CdnL/TRCF family regulator